MGKLCELIWNSSKRHFAFWQLQTGNATHSHHIQLPPTPHATCHMPRVVVVRLSRRRRMCVKHIKIILFFFFARQNALAIAAHLAGRDTFSSPLLLLLRSPSAAPPSLPPSLAVNFHISVAASWQTATRRGSRLLLPPGGIKLAHIRFDFLLFLLLSFFL